MRFFKNSDTAYDQIAKEMINLEAGQMVYNPNGNLVEGERRDYPKIHSESGKCSISCHFSGGFIFIPESVSMLYFYDKIYEKLNLYQPADHLSKGVLITKSGQFCSIEVETVLSGTSSQLSMKARRKIDITRDYKHYTHRDTAVNSRFIWKVVRFPDDLMNSYQNFLCRSSTINAILFDKDDLTTYKNGEFRLNGFKIKKFRAYDSCIFLKNEEDEFMGKLHLNHMYKEYEILIKYFSPRNFQNPYTPMHKKIKYYEMKWEDIINAFQFSKPKSKCDCCKVDLFGTIYYTIHANRDCNYYTPEKYSIKCPYCMRYAATNSTFVLRTTYPRSFEEVVTPMKKKMRKIALAFRKGRYWKDLNTQIATIEHDGYKYKIIKENDIYKLKKRDLNDNITYLINDY